MWTSRNAGVRPEESPATSTQGLMFSNTFSEFNLDASVPQTGRTTRVANSTEYALSGGTVAAAYDSLPAVPPFRGDPDNVVRPERTKFRTKGGTIGSTTSSIWSESRGHLSKISLSNVAAPWEHETLEMDEHNSNAPATVRQFDYRRQRRRLVINSTSQWAMTVLICAAIVAVLYSYSTIPALSQTQKHVFNALITGLSLFLGLNLASSLRGYAMMMRWRLLAAKYRTLQEFDLILSCDDQMKVFRLLWAGKTPGRRWSLNKTQMLCLIWLLVSLALQMFTALLGLMYSVNISTVGAYPVWGNVSIAYLGNINLDYSWNNQADYNFDFVDQVGAANTYGIEGGQFVNVSYIPLPDQTYQEMYYSNPDLTTFSYRFQDQDPASVDESTPSKRTVSTTARCDQFNILSGGDGSEKDQVTYFDTNLQRNVTQQVLSYAPGCSTWMSNTNPTCGPRCTNVMMLLAADNRTKSVPFPLWFSCNNTVGQVTNVDDYDESSNYMLPDQQARAWAGAIGFNGIVYNQTGPDLQYVVYEPDSAFTLGGFANNDPGVTNVAQTLMSFTAGGLAATDVNGPRINVTGYYPTQAQVVQVEWNYAIPLLAGIPGGHFLVLLAVLIFANKVVIKDESHLATARLLRPVVDKLGEKGCLLTGTEIASVLGNFRLRYGVRDQPRESTTITNNGFETAFVRHVDVIEASEGLGRQDARMADGLYDGTSTWK